MANELAAMKNAFTLLERCCISHLLFYADSGQSFCWPCRVATGPISLLMLALAGLGRATLLLGRTVSSRRRIAIVEFVKMSH
jgi:hypothetical protein